MKRVIAVLFAVAVLAFPKPVYAAPTFTSFAGASFAIEHVEVIDGLGTPTKRDWTVVVDHGTISAAGPSPRVTIPPGAGVIDGRGGSLIPVIVGMHEHLYYETNEHMAGALTMLFSAPKLYLAGGVTTARTTGSLETYAELNLKTRIASGAEPGPDLDVTGPYLSGPKEPLLIQYASLSSPQDARETVDFWTARGVTSFKAFLALTRGELAAVISEAHARGALVAGHLCSITMSEAADLGIDELEHGIMQSSDFVAGKVPDVCPSFPSLFKSWAALQPSDPRIAALIAKLVAHHVAVTSTLAVMESGLGLSPMLPQSELVLLNADARGGYAQARADSGKMPGFADQREIELLVSAGFTPIEAIQIATANGARAMHCFDRIGSVERGKQADLLLVRGDAATDIGSIEHPVLVVRAGIAYDPRKLLGAATGSVGRE